MHRPLEHADEHWDRVLQTNLTSQFVLARELARPMVERGAGKIIFTASHAELPGRGQRRPATRPASRASPGSTSALANEWAPHGVNVNAIAPGLHRDRQHAGAAGRSGAQSRRSSSASPPAGGASPTDLDGRDRLPRLAPRPTTCTGSCSPSTAAGSGDDRRTGSRRRATCPPGRHGREPETARQLGSALAGAGARAVEITFRSEAAADAIEALAGDGFVVGAGTVRSRGAGGRRGRRRRPVRRLARLRPRRRRTLRERRRAGAARRRDRHRADRGARRRGVDGEVLPGRGARRPRR